MKKSKIILLVLLFFISILFEGKMMTDGQFTGFRIKYGYLSTCWLFAR